MNIRNGVPLINGVEPAWGDIVAAANGVPFVGITAIKYGDKQDVQNNYGAGRHPVSRSKGRITPSAAITLYKSEIVALQRQAPNGRLQEIDPSTLRSPTCPKAVLSRPTRFATASSTRIRWTGRKAT